MFNCCVCTPQHSQQPLKLINCCLHRAKQMPPFVRVFSKASQNCGQTQSHSRGGNPKINIKKPPSNILLTVSQQLLPMQIFSMYFLSSASLCFVAHFRLKQAKFNIAPISLSMKCNCIMQIHSTLRVLRVSFYELQLASVTRAKKIDIS